MFERLVDEKNKMGSVGIPAVFGSILVYDSGFTGTWGIIESVTGIRMIIAGVSLAIWRLIID
jgi:hypothetical protein